MINRFTRKNLYWQKKIRKKYSVTRFAGDYQWQLPEIKSIHVEKTDRLFSKIFSSSFLSPLHCLCRIAFTRIPFAPPVKDIQLSPRQNRRYGYKNRRIKKS
jgi:hypothetical protein